MHFQFVLHYLKKTAACTENTFHTAVEIPHSENFTACSHTKELQNSFNFILVPSGKIFRVRNYCQHCQQMPAKWDILGFLNFLNFRHTSIASSVAGMCSRKTKLPILTNNCMYNNSAKLWRYILYLLVKYGMPNLGKICSWYTESKFLPIFSWPLNISTVKLTSYSFQQSTLWLYYVKKISAGLVIKWLRYWNLKSLGKCPWLPNLWVPATKRSHFLRNHSR